MRLGKGEDRQKCSIAGLPFAEVGIVGAAKGKPGPTRFGVM
jgi:hypothetical protein